MGPRIRVVRIIDRLNIGGPAKHVVWLTAGLSSHEFETVLVTGTVAKGEGDMSYFARAAGVEPLVIKEMSRELSLQDMIVVPKLLRQLWNLKPQIVHTHKSKAGAAGRIAAMIYKWMTPSALWLRPRNCRIVHTYHGHTFHSYFGAARARLFRAIERALAKLCTDRIIVVSEQQRREISQRYRIGQPEQFRVIPLGVDVDQVVERRGSLRHELGLASDDVLIGSVGRLCEVKNQVLLLEAAARFLRWRMAVGRAASPSYWRMDAPPRAHFVIIGDGHLRSELEQHAQQLGIADRVTFLGFRQDAVALYADLDLFALTSLNEGTPLTLIEAMCCGRAVAATEVGGVVDLLGARRVSFDGFWIWDHGVTAPSQDAPAFARALRYLIERPELRRQMGERGRTFVRTHLSRERLVSDIEELYRELMGRDELEGASDQIFSSSAPSPRQGHKEDNDEGSDYRWSRVHRLTSG